MNLPGSIALLVLTGEIVVEMAEEDPKCTYCFQPITGDILKYEYLDPWLLTATATEASLIMLITSCARSATLLSVLAFLSRISVASLIAPRAGPL